MKIFFLLIASLLLWIFVLYIVGFLGLMGYEMDLAFYRNLGSFVDMGLNLFCGYIAAGLIAVFVLVINIILLGVIYVVLKGCTYLTWNKWLRGGCHAPMV